MPRSKQAGTRKGRKSTFGCVYKLRRRDGSQYENWFVRFVEAGKRVQRGGFATKDAGNGCAQMERTLRPLLRTGAVHAHERAEGVHFVHGSPWPA